MNYWNEVYTYVQVSGLNVYGMANYTRIEPASYNVGFFNGEETYVSELSTYGGASARDSSSVSIKAWQLDLKLSVYNMRKDTGAACTSLDIKCGTLENYNKLLGASFFVADSQNFSFTITFDWDNASYQSNLIEVLNQLSIALPDGEELATKINGYLIENRLDLHLAVFPSEPAPSQVCCIS